MAMRLEGIMNRMPNVEALNNEFGSRPGGYSVDPGWFRFNHFTGKVDLWDATKRKWFRVKEGSVFEANEEGQPECVTA